MSHKLANRPPHVAVLNFPSAAHPTSLLRFIRIISALSPDIKFTFFSTSTVNSSLFSSSNIKCLDNITPYNVYDGLPEGYVPHGPQVLEQLWMFLEKAPEIFERALKQVETETGHKFGCLISDGFLYFSGDIAEKMNIPWVAKWSAPRPLLVQLETDMIREKVGASEQEDKTLDFLPGFSNKFRASDLPDGVVFENRELHFHQNVLDKMGQKLRQATVVAVDSFETMDFKISEELKKRLKKLLFVGPLHHVRLVPSAQSDDDQEEMDACLPWLDNHEPVSVAYISSGTLVTLPPMEVVALAEALEEGGFPFIWSFRGNLEVFPKGFIEKTTTTGKVVPWVNQVQILNHPSIGVFVTHCGWKSIIESVTNGVPMIGRPQFAEQKLNMRSVEAVWKIGMEIEGGVITKTGAIKALEQVLSLEEGKEMRRRVGVLQNLAHEAVGPNGSSTQNLKALVEIIKSS